MKHYYIFLCCLLLAWPSMAQNSLWKPFSVDKQFTVRFPTDPQEMDIPGTMNAIKHAKRNDPMIQTAHAFLAEDSVAIYMLICLPLLEDPELPQSTSARQAYYKDRTIPLLVAQGQLLGQTIEMNNAKAGVDIITVKFRVLNSEGSPTVRFIRLLTVGRTMYQLHFSPKDRTGNNCIAQRTKFLNSIVVTKKK